MHPTISLPCRAKPKRIIIACDGTWQSTTSLETDHGPASNIGKLCRIIASAGTSVGEHGAVEEWQQVVWYDPGVGTGRISAIEQAVQGGNGAGLLDNVIEAFNFIINNYTPGDALYFFGFSRGAFTARACAGLVWEVGILRPSSMPEFIELYKTYIDSGDFTTDFARTEAWEEFKRRKGGMHAVVGSYTQEVEVIGVFDTVGALGVPDLGHVIRFDNSAFRQPYQFHDVELNPGVKHAYQALALDERRDPFTPCIWHASPSKNPTLDLAQCWFPGVHKNIGGGSSQSDTEHSHWEQLASISYTWMLDRIRPFLAFDEDELKAQQRDWEVMLRPPTKEEVEKARNAQTVAQRVTNWFTSGSDDDKPGYAAGKITDSYEGIYVIGRPVDRIPLNLTPEDIAAGKYTNEYVHFSVSKRQEALAASGGYVPGALKGWSRRRGASGWEWVNDEEEEESKVLPEWEVGSVPDEWSMEAWLLARDAGGR